MTKKLLLISVFFGITLISFAQNTDCDFETAVHLYKHNQLQQSLNCVEMLILQEPLNSELLLLNATILYERKQLQAALTRTNQSIELKPTADAYLLQGLINTDLKNYRKAEVDFTQSLDLQLQHETYFNRAQVRKLNGDIRGACFDYRKAQQFGNPDAANFLKKYCDK
ncbi:MAG: hypothetical protein LBR55_05795 [Bacteroidales bacterium]|jgi:tetratricopeptide (TPR) repeat protein|nr:hypothetical protein [Bacteroidales bacterium]